METTFNVFYRQIPDRRTDPYPGTDLVTLEFPVNLTKSITYIGTHKMK